MKKHPISSLFVAAALALAAGFSLFPTTAQDLGKVKRSGRIEMQIDPSSPGFNMDQIEKNIRNSAKAMGMDAAQEKQLDDAIEQLRDSVSKMKDGGSFNWKWEFNSDSPSTPPSRSKGGADPFKGKSEPSPRGAREPQPLDQNAAEEMLRKMLGGQGGPNGNGMDPRKLMEEMLKQFGAGEDQNGQQGPGGQRQFRFRLGPNGLEKDGEGNNGGNPLQGLQKMFGQRDHMYDPDTAPRDSKYSRSTLAEYRSCVKDARKSTVSVLKEGKQVAFGAVVTADGYIVTKASEVGKGPLECEFMDGNIVAAKVISKLDTYDLVLLKVEGTNHTPIVWKEASIPVGTMLAASGIDEDPISVGVLSVPTRNLDDSQKGFAGIGLDENEDKGGVAVRTVVPDAPGAKAGLEPGDVILSIDGEKVNHPHELMKVIASKSPGDSVKFSVKSTAGKTEDVKVTLGSREEYKRMLVQGVDPTALMGTDLSGRPGGFPDALQNDLGINANQCGGPVVDIEGNVVGLNIARSGRTSTLMLSGKLMKGILSEVADGKLSMIKDTDALDKDLKRAEAALKAAQEAVKAAKEAREKAFK